ncbi:SDR family NAD(P)-dependent oxidoreductase [Acidothermaceae bacterium B102]|nr:SDR family NAD(P)-dependent oxidoreductase [Acidothermaceae bacterium B102]
MPTTPFGHDTTAAEVVVGVDLTGKRAVVTGAASGIGVETARALATAGAEVTLAVRDLGAGEAVAKEINGATGRDDVRVGYLDLAKRSSVEAFVSDWSGPLNILVNNAGVMASPRMYTVDGWELQFGTNHMGHFILTTGLRPALAAADGARVVSVSSSGHLRSSVDFDDLRFMQREYDPWLAYGQSKTANIWMANEIAVRWRDDGIVANSLMPGAIHTNLQRHVSAQELDRLRARSGPDIGWKSVEQGAATSVLLAASPLVAGVTGRYYENCNEAEPNAGGARTGYATWAYDEAGAARLWDTSLQLLA